MDNINKLIEINLRDRTVIGLHELAQFLGVSLHDLRQICLDKKIACITEDGNMFVEMSGNITLDSLKNLKTYIDDGEIELKIINNIILKQPTTITKISKDIGIKREVVWRIIDEITYNDCALSEGLVGRRWYLFYNKKL